MKLSDLKLGDRIVLHSLNPAPTLFFKSVETAGCQLHGEPFQRYFFQVVEPGHNHKKGTNVAYSDFDLEKLLTAERHKPKGNEMQHENAIEILKEKRAGLDAAIAILEGGKPAATKPKTVGEVKAERAALAAMEPKEKEPTIEDVIAACQAHTAANGNDKKVTIEIIKSFGVANVKLLPKEKFADILKALA